jgi:Na+/H+ antiporter NhaD/arsenite permease-like protein
VPGTLICRIASCGPTRTKGERQAQRSGELRTHVNNNRDHVLNGSPLVALISSLLLLVSAPAHAATDLDGAALNWPWALPFAGVLLSIAIGPLVFPRIWHHHYGKITAGWAALAFLAILAAFGASTAFGALVHAVLAEYVSFIVVLFALYTVAGGILVTGQLRGTPLVNATILAIGSVIASLVGTTGAAMILIRPLLRANRGREHKAHLVVFFIILVANVGGALSPLGDPPLFLGFLRGIDFLWPARNLWMQTALVAGLVLAIFVVLDICLFRRDKRVPDVDITEPVAVPVHSLINVPLIGLIVVVILISGIWNPGIGFDLLGTRFELPKLLRDLALTAIAAVSLWLTPDEHRAANGFTWEPIKEVAKLFLAIFITIIPVLAMLEAGARGAFAPLLRLVIDAQGAPHEVAFFWLTGALSAFLDNAPTYLVFFELAGGDPQMLMGPLAGTLAAISLGAVYMGALTYIGNAPNLMVHAIAEEHGVKMPSFFGYLFWASLVLIPIFALLTLLPISPLLKWH